MGVGGKRRLENQIFHNIAQTWECDEQRSSAQWCNLKSNVSCLDLLAP
jgi:hypothetical protein